MPYFGERSKKNLETCCIEIQLIMNEAIKGWDFSVICGHRSAREQNEAYRSGKSKVRYPDSKHNMFPSDAIDITPYPINYKDIGSFYLLVGYIIRVAEEKGVKLKYGGDWDGDRKTADQTFHDLGHLEIVR